MPLLTGVPPDRARRRAARGIPCRADAGKAAGIAGGMRRGGLSRYTDFIHLDTPRRGARGLPGERLQ